MLIDMNSVIKARRSSSPQAILAGNATLTGEIIDRQGYESLEFLILMGALTDSTLTATLYEGDASNMVGETAVAAKDVVGQANPIVIDGAAAGNDNTVCQLGYVGNKRYVRLKIVQTGATTGGYICSVAIQGMPKSAPVAAVTPA